MKNKTDAELAQMYNDLLARHYNKEITTDEALKINEEVSKEITRRLIERGQLPDPDVNPN